MNYFILATFVVFFASCTSTSKKSNQVDTGEIRHHSEQLKTMDIEQIQNLVHKKLSQVSGSYETRPEEYTYEDQRDSSDPVQSLKEALLIVLAKPDQNTGTSRLVERVLAAGRGHTSTPDLLELVARSATVVLNNDDVDTRAGYRVQNTYLYIMINLLGELSPLVKMNEEKRFRQIVRDIKKADIDISDGLKSYRLLNSMDIVEEPSELAEKILGDDDDD